MSTLFLMCGLPGSGKTALAKQIEHAHRAVRLTPDDWLAALSLDPRDEVQRAAVESLQWRIAERVLGLGGDVVLDFGCWSRGERDRFRARAAAPGARTELRFLDVPREELVRRLTERDAMRPPGSVPVTEAELDEYIGMFEPPGPDELLASG